MLVAGIDIGNSTTEVVFVEIDGGTARVVGADRMPTRGWKGSEQSIRGAASLVQRTSRMTGRTPAAAAVCHLRPVHTEAMTVPEETTPTGRLHLAGRGAQTAAGLGFGVGKPFLLGDRQPTGPVVALVGASIGYRRAAELIVPIAVSGLLQGVVLTNDEAVLVSHRIGSDVPVIDEVDIADLLDADQIALEAQPAGQPLQRLTDPIYLSSALGLAPAEVADAGRLAARLYDNSNAVVALRHTTAQQRTLPVGWVQTTSAGRLSLPGAEPVLRAGNPGDPTAYSSDGLAEAEVDDLYLVDLAALADTVVARDGALETRSVVLAALRRQELVDPGELLAQLLQIEVYPAVVETRAAALGALSTPGAAAQSVVVDLGGGTIDVVAGETAIVAAGAGDLLTAGVAAILGSSRAVAEWAKRGPSYRVEAPQLRLAEDGTRTFLDPMATADSIGCLIVAGPAGPLPFDRAHSPAEWRALRLRLKRTVLGDNVARCLRAHGDHPSAVLVVGGPAGDDEILSSVARGLPAGTPVGRANAGGVLAHRHVVAYGAVLAAMTKRI